MTRNRKRLYLYGSAAAAMLILISATTANAGATAYTNLVEVALGVTLDDEQRDSVRRLWDAFNKYGDGDISKLHYIVATCWHESKLRSIPEKRCASYQNCYVLQNAYWYTGYYGRGYVQLTWEDNYQKMQNIFGWPLVENPDLALNPAKAAAITVYGMMNGSFTGKKLDTYINDAAIDYYNARRVVNGTESASLIEGYANDIFYKYIDG